MQERAGVVMAFKIVYGPEALQDLKNLSASIRRSVFDGLEIHLRNEPDVQTGKIKGIAGISAEWAQSKPFWQLRVGQHRVFYEVDREKETVLVLAVRLKSPHKQMEDIV